MKVKICGITDEKTAVYAAEQGADALGFVFADSRRRISLPLAKSIIARLPGHVEKIGVFVNETKENIDYIAAEAGLTAIQLHGDESPEFCRLFSLPVVKAFNIRTARDLEKIHHYDCEYVLLDSAAGKYRGGSGLSFDWELLQGARLNGKKVILAGGLNEENVREAIRQANPYMVDVSSGVEIGGKKDFQKIRNFIKAAKTAGRADQEHGLTP